jgi:hypothetical protein
MPLYPITPLIHQTEVTIFQHQFTFFEFNDEYGKVIIKRVPNQRHLVLLVNINATYRSIVCGIQDFFGLAIRASHGGRKVTHVKNSSIGCEKQKISFLVELDTLLAIIDTLFFIRTVNDRQHF